MQCAVPIFESASISLGDFPIVRFPMWVMSYRPQTTPPPLLVKYTNMGNSKEEMLQG